MTRAESSIVSKSPLLNRDDLRICHVRGVDSLDTTREPGTQLLDVFDLGRLSASFRSADELAPQVAAAATRPSLKINGERWRGEDREVAWQRLRLRIPSGGLVDVRVLSIRWSSLADVIDLLEDLNYEAIEGEPTRWDVESVSDLGAPVTDVSPFHQLVFMPDGGEEPDWEAIQRLVYRADLDAIEEHSSIGHPEELNRRPGQLAAVGRFGSVLWGLQDYLEASLVVSAALTVSAASTVRSVQRSARGHLLSARELLTASGARDSNELSRDAALLGIDLAIGAEAHADIADLLPSLRVGSFHRALYEAADLRSQIDVAGRMLDRLAGALDVDPD